MQSSKAHSIEVEETGVQYPCAGWSVGLSSRAGRRPLFFHAPGVEPLTTALVSYRLGPEHELAQHHPYTVAHALGGPLDFRTFTKGRYEVNNLEAAQPRLAALVEHGIKPVDGSLFGHVITVEEQGEDAVIVLHGSREAAQRWAEHDHTGNAQYEHEIGRGSPFFNTNKMGVTGALWHMMYNGWSNSPETPKGLHRCWYDANSEVQTPFRLRHPGDVLLRRPIEVFDGGIERLVEKVDAFFTEGPRSARTR